MCGISAIIHRNDQPVSTSLLHGVNEKARHRGPDGEGIFMGSNFGLAHRRLAILDLTPCGHQPMEGFDQVISYNGEIFNFRRLRTELEAQGYVFKSRTDTEVILAAYDHWKEDCCSHFEGMWSFVIFDRKKNILFCSRDRFGQKPLHYGLTANYFVIVSEIKQMLAIPEFKPECNMQAAFHYLNHGALNYSSDTFFRHVYSLPAGHNMVYNLDTHTYTIKQWYAFREATKPGKISLADAAVEFRRLFEQSVSTRTQSDVAVGASLSGGLDSSAVCCTLGHIQEEPMKNISICWDDSSIDEQQYVDAIIASTGHTSIKVFPDMNELNTKFTLDKLVYSQDQPILSASHFAEFKMYEAAAAEGLTVILDGHGADEYLGGYTTFNFYYLHGLLNKGEWLDFYQQWRSLPSAQKLSFSLFLRNCIELRYRKFFPGVHPALNPKWAKNYLEKDPGLLPGAQALDMPNFTVHQLFVSSLPYQVHSADRSSMHHSVEARLPFLDHRLVEFTYTLPDTQKISQGFSKLIMRKAMTDILPEKVRNRKCKLGYPAPEQNWMFKNSQWVYKEVTECLNTLPSIFNEKYIRSLLTAFTNGVKNDYSILFRLISFNRWARIFHVSFPSAQ
jgi:asparagine synthase (glutamine-hydrolysing)